MRLKSHIDDNYNSSRAISNKSSPISGMKFGSNIFTKIDNNKFNTNIPKYSKIEPTKFNLNDYRNNNNNNNNYSVNTSNNTNTNNTYNDNLPTTSIFYNI